MRTLFLEVGNVLTRGMAVRESGPDALATREESTPTCIYHPGGGVADGFDPVLASLETAFATGPVPAAPPERRIALTHLDGSPRAAVIGLAGLATTELTIQAVLRHLGSSVVQVRSTDAASLEAQLVGVRSVPLDVLAFTTPSHQTAERLVAGGGVRPRVLPKLIALYNGPAGEHDQVEETLGQGIEFLVLPPVRQESSAIAIGPTEDAVRNIADRAIAADRSFELLSGRGFTVTAFARAFTGAAESLGRAWRESGPKGRDGLAAPPGVVMVDLGGRFTEMAGVGQGPASRWVDDLDAIQLGLPGGRSPDGVEAAERIEVESAGRWLPFEWASTGLADALANYLRRPFSFPSNWRQALMLMALGRERLARARQGFRGAPTDKMLTGDWRKAVGMYVVSGGYFRYLAGPGLALIMVLDGLEPTGVSEIWCDRLGYLPFAAAGGAEILLDRPSAVTRLATVVSPVSLRLDWRRPHEDDLLALVTVEREGGASSTFRIIPGALMRFPLRPGEQARLTVHPMRAHDFGAGDGKPWQGRVVGGLLGLVFDTRGRPVALPLDSKVRQAKLLEWLNTLGASQIGWRERVR